MALAIPQQCLIYKSWFSQSPDLNWSTEARNTVSKFLIVLTSVTRKKKLNSWEFLKSFAKIVILESLSWFFCGCSVTDLVLLFGTPWAAAPGFPALVFYALYLLSCIPTIFCLMSIRSVKFNGIHWRITAYSEYSNTGKRALMFWAVLYLNNVTFRFSVLRWTVLHKTVKIGNLADLVLFSKACYFLEYYS